MGGGKLEHTFSSTIHAHTFSHTHARTRTRTHAHKRVRAHTHIVDLTDTYPVCAAWQVFHPCKVRHGNILTVHTFLKQRPRFCDVRVLCCEPITAVRARHQVIRDAVHRCCPPVLPENEIVECWVLVNPFRCESASPDRRASI